MLQVFFEDLDLQNYDIKNLELYVNEKNAADYSLNYSGRMILVRKRWFLQPFTELVLKSYDQTQLLAW